MLLLDDVLSPMARIRLSGALNAKTAELKAAQDAKQSLKTISISKAILGILEELGALKSTPVQAPVTVGFYPAEQRRTQGARQKDNDAAVSLLQTLQDAGRPATDAEKAVLARFSGYGGGLTDPEGKEGSPYEYYTPAPVAAGMWDLLREMGFSGGKVLDPSAGSGVFAATRPADAVIDQVELSALSGGVNGLVNDAPTVSTTISPFEAVAANTPDESYDVVMTNVPFGDAKLRTTAKLDTKLRTASMEAYFILRSLDKLKPGGLAAFIVPPRIVSGNDAAMRELRYKISMRSEFLGAYRLPNKVFQDASDADTIVDVVVFRKFSRDAKVKVDELSEQNLESLKAANVLWDSFLSGKYFKGEGLKFQLGEFKAKDPSKFRDVDRVVSDQSTANIAKLLRKFPGSRIDWEALDALEAAPLAYKDGDVVYQDGRTLEYRAGAWVEREQAGGADNSAELAVRYQTPLSAIGAGWEEAGAYVAALRERARALDVPDWLTAVSAGVTKLPEGKRADWFKALTAGFAAIQVMNDKAPHEPFNYATNYPSLSKQIQETAHFGNKTEASFLANLKDAAKILRVVYSKKTGFSGRWKGEGRAAVDMGNLTPIQSYERVKYASGDDFGFVSIADIAGSQGDDFDPMADDEWCVSPDGKSVMRAEDYFFGTLADYRERQDRDLSAATDAAVRMKMLRQMDIAKSRLIIPDVERMTFNLFTPFIPIARKVEFLRENVDQRFYVDFDDEGKSVIKIDIPSAKNEHDRMLKRYAEHLRVGTLTTRTTEDEIASDPALESARISRLREMASGNNAKFNIWAKSNSETFAEVKQKFSDPANLYFAQPEDESPLEIAGMNPGLSLHGYQCAEVRRQAKKFGGINGFDVGLGKTFSALAAVQYVHTIGVKKKTFFVVPNAVLSNWNKEAKRAYASTEDCLFIGMDVSTDADGVETLAVSSSNYARDFAKVMQNNHRKIFMTLEAFSNIPMREETLEAYQQYIASVDPSFAEASDKKAEAIRKEGKRDKLTDSGVKSSAIPFFEDMGVDSLVIDEAHMMKNSKLLLDFQGAKYLSAALASDRGLDAQVKAWFIRGQSKNHDGVMPLTATPITNSPLEIYGMLTLAAGEEELNRRLGIRGADDFMNAFCEVTQQEEPDIIGRPRAGRVFIGLQNVELLRSALGQIANVKDADDVGSAVAIPDEDPVKISVDLDEESRNKLMDYQLIYQTAREIENDGGSLGPVEMVMEYSEMTGEPIALLAHPFNLINKMSNLILDKELDQGMTVYRFTQSQAAKAKAAIDAFNAKNFKEKRARAGAITAAEDTQVRLKKGKGTEESGVTEVIVTVRAKINSGEIIIDTTDFATQNKFLAFAEKQKLDLDVSVSPKLAALLDNFKKERAMPRAGKLSKQLIFCDSLAMHNKIRMALIKHCGVKPSKIGIINAEAVTDPADMQDLQDGFNADAEDNRYEVIIANKKGEVGINLQRGTQAIHHFTIGWTPDSLTQRNGRGVRQGNYLSRVTVYHYDANGTFDEYKRTLVGKKDNWITAVMDVDGANSVQISGGLSNREMHDLIMSSGDEQAMQKARAQIETRERKQQTEAARESQIQTLRIIQGQKDWIAKFGNATEWRNAKITEYASTKQKAEELQAKLARTKNDIVAGRIEGQLSDMTARLAALEGLLKGASLGWNNTVDEGLGFRIESYGRDKGKPKPTGRVDENSKLAEKYREELGNVNRALDRARSEYAEQAKKPGAYTESTLKVFEAGDGAVIGGVLLTKGMVGSHKGELWIAMDAKTLVNPLTRARRDSASVVSGFEFFGPEDADEDWTPIAEQCAALDEATIAEGNAADGFAVDSDRLFSTFSADIAARVKAVPIGLERDPRNIKLKAPLYPVPIPPDTKGGAVTRLVIQQQAEAITWSTKKSPYGNAQEVVRLKDLRFGDTDYSVDTGEELVKYAIAHSVAVSSADIGVLSSRYSFTNSVRAAVPAFSQGFNDSLAIATQSAKSRDELVMTVDSVIRRAFPMVSFDEDYPPSAVMNPREAAALNTAAAKVANGGKDVLMLEAVMRSSDVKYALSKFIASRIKENVQGYILDGKSIIASHLGDIVEKLVLDSSKESVLPDTSVVAAEASAIVIAEFPGAVTGTTVFAGETWLGEFLQYFRYSVPNAEAQQAVSDFIAAQATGGFDVTGAINLLNSVPGVQSVSILKTTVSRPNKAWHGAYAYQPNLCLCIKTARGTQLSDRISEKGAGLVGRYFDKSDGWVVTIPDGEKDSRGGPVASVFDLMVFVGIDPEPFKPKG